VRVVSRLCPEGEVTTALIRIDGYLTEAKLVTALQRIVLTALARQSGGGTNRRSPERSDSARRVSSIDTGEDLTRRITRNRREGRPDAWLAEHTDNLQAAGVAYVVF